MAVRLDRSCGIGEFGLVPPESRSLPRARRAVPCISAALVARISFWQERGRALDPDWQPQLAAVPAQTAMITTDRASFYNRPRMKNDARESCILDAKLRLGLVSRSRSWLSVPRCLASGGFVGRSRSRARIDVGSSARPCLCSRYGPNENLAANTRPLMRGAATWLEHGCNLTYLVPLPASQGASARSAGSPS